MASPIPSFYSAFFKTIDPILALAGAILPQIDSRTYLKDFSPAAISPPAIETKLLLDIMTGFYTGTALLQIFLLRAKSSDLTVWRFVEANILIQDVAILGGFARALSVQGRTNWTAWRIEEWRNIIILGVVAIIRIAFLTGVGLRSSKGPKKL